jgi:hypothetical protein
MKTQKAAAVVTFFSRLAAERPAEFLERTARKAVAGGLMALLVPMTVGDMFAQGPPPPPPDQQYDQGGGQQQAYQPLPPETLNQLVAPIALYPDSLVAQVLAASTYPAQVASAEQFVSQNQGVPPDQLGEMANQQPWDPSVKSLVAFPQVLSNLNQNMQWTTQLGNAYYNQPQDVMTAVQQMRQRAYDAGNLRSNQQLAVQYEPGAIVIQPAQPEVVYVPYYNPWVVYGAPIAPYGYYHYYGPPPGVVLGVGLAIGFGIGIGIGAFAHFGWGFHNWGPDWHSHTVVFNHNTYISNSVTVVNHGNYGGFDRNPQARAFNHTQAVSYAHVNHTTINNVSVNRTNNNFNRTNVNNGAVNNNRNFNGNTAARPGQFNNNGAARPGQFNSTPTGAARPGQFNSTPTGAARPGQPGQLTGGARPGTEPGQYNASRPTAQAGQFNQGARPATSAGQFNRPAPAAQSNFNRGAQAPQAARPQPQQHTQAPKPAAAHSENHAESHPKGGGEEHHH